MDWEEDVWGSGGIAPRMTSAIDGCEWWASRLGHFTPIPVVLKSGWTPEPVRIQRWRRGKFPSLSHPGIEPLSSNL